MTSDDQCGGADRAAGPAGGDPGAAVGRPAGGLRGDGGPARRAGRDGARGVGRRAGQRRRPRRRRADAGGRPGPAAVLPGRGRHPEPHRGGGRGGGQRPPRQAGRRRPAAGPGPAGRGACRDGGGSVRSRAGGRPCPVRGLGWKKVVLVGIRRPARGRAGDLAHVHRPQQHAGRGLAGGHRRRSTESSEWSKASVWAGRPARASSSRAASGGGSPSGRSAPVRGTSSQARSAPSDQARGRRPRPCRSGSVGDRGIGAGDRLEEGLEGGHEVEVVGQAGRPAGGWAARWPGRRSARTPGPGAGPRRPRPGRWPPAPRRGGPGRSRTGGGRRR